MQHLVSRFTLLAVILIAGPAYAEGPVNLKKIADWKVQVSLPASANKPAVTQELTIVPPGLISVVDEKHDSLPLYNSNGPQYLRGIRLKGIIAESLTAPDLIVPESVQVRLADRADSPVMERGKDFEFESRWGGLGRLPGGRIPENTPVFISYQHTLQRIDSIVLTAQGEIVLREGTAAPTLAVAPELKAGERRLGNVWFPKRSDDLSENQLFPILEDAFPEPAKSSPSIAEQRIPKTMAKIRAGEPVRILAWGDSVTEATYLADPKRDRWQEQFATRLRERFPNAKIEMLTEAWGGRNTGSYLGVPPGQPHNYQETVLNVRPDLIISEFVNDAGLSPAAVEERYSKLLADFQGIGAEWIILTPHYVRPDWMGLDREVNVDDDPRPYVRGLREFTKNHQVALADASLRYGRLWRQGIPYNSLMHNCINHPDPRGMKLFVDALMELFPAQ